MFGKTMAALTVLAVVLVSCVACQTDGDGRSTVSTESSDHHAAIGVFDSRAIALAYGRSSRPDCMLAKVKAVHEQHAAAEQNQDTALMESLEQEAGALQEEIHNQVFGGAPIPDILGMLDQTEVQKIAHSSGVVCIVTDPLFLDPGLSTVDVSLQLCELFEPDAQTVQMIQDLMATDPVPLSELNHDHYRIGKFASLRVDYSTRRSGTTRSHRIAPGTSGHGCSSFAHG